MIVYRVQGTTKTGWVTEWFDRQRDAREAAEIMGELYERVHVDRLDCGDTKEDFVHALNHAHVHRMNWPA